MGLQVYSRTGFFVLITAKLNTNFRHKTTTKWNLCRDAVNIILLNISTTNMRRYDSVFQFIFPSDRIQNTFGMLSLLCINNFQYITLGCSDFTIDQPGQMALTQVRGYNLRNNFGSLFVVV